MFLCFQNFFYLRYIPSFHIVKLILSKKKKYIQNRESSFLIGIHFLFSTANRIIKIIVSFVISLRLWFSGQSDTNMRNVFMTNEIKD